MAKARPSVQKRKNELNRLEKRMRKEARKEERNANKVDRTQAEGDPDLDGIVPGPQSTPVVDDDGFTI